MDHSKPFCNIVRALINAVGEFHDLLQRESAALQDGKLDGLTDLSRQKMLLSEQLDRLDRQRRAVIGRHTNAVDDLAAMSEALINCDNGAGMLTDWKGTVEKLAECRTLNERSGAAIHTQTRHTERALQTLAGDVAAAVTYGPGAASNLTHRSKEFGLA